MSKVQSNSIMYKGHWGGRVEGMECLEEIIGGGVADSMRGDREVLHCQCIYIHVSILVHVAKQVLYNYMIISVNVVRWHM